MSDDPKSDRGSAAVKAVPTPEPSTSRDSQMGRMATGMKLVTISPSSELTDSIKELQDATGDPLLGNVIDNRYLVEAVLGEGGMGVVYRCRHNIINKKVAMKVLRADMARDPEVTERFLLEAKAASAIGSEHIIDISDFGRLPDGATYFVMEYLDGQPLADLLQGEQPVPVDRLVHIARQLAEGLQAAHDEGIVHRDLKPDNIYLVPRRGDPDFVKVLDFGIAKVSTGAAGKLTRAGSIFGTPHYMSPEQAAGAPVDHRGDIYAFGVILYEMASGKVPFDADNFMGILTQHMYKAPVPIRALVPVPQEIPPGLEAIILKCMSKRAEERYDDMRALVDDLDRLRDGAVPTAVEEMMARSGGFNVPADYFDKAKMPALVPASPREQRSRLPLFAALFGVAAAAAVAVGIFTRSGESPAAPAVSAEPVVASAAPVPSPSAAEVPVVEPVTDETFVVTTQVVVAVDPLSAHVFRGEEDLGMSPVVIEVEEGKTVELQVRHEDYETETLSLDGSRRKVAVELQPTQRTFVPRRTYRRPTPKDKPEPPKPAPPPQPKLGTGEIVNPWAQ